MTKLKAVPVYVLIVILCSAAIYYLYSVSHPLSGLFLKYDKDEIVKKAERFINNVHADVEQREQEVSLGLNEELTKKVLTDSGYIRGLELLRSGVPAFYWDVEWKSETSNIIIGEGGPPVINQGTVKVTYDTRGNLLKFSREVNDSVGYRILTSDEAKAIAERFLSQYTGENLNSSAGDGLRFDSEKKIELKNRTDYEFTWKGNHGILQIPARVTVDISGNFVSKYDLVYEVTDEGRGTARIIEATATILFYIIVFVLIAVIAYKKIKAYEISFKLAAVMGIITVITAGINLYLQIEGESGLDLFLPLIMGSLFFGVGVFLVWGVSEAIARESSGDKFINLDLLTKGYFFHSRVGDSVMKGTAAGFMASLFWLLLILAASQVSDIWFQTDDNQLWSHFSNNVPILEIINKQIYTNLFLISVFMFFVYSGLKRRFNNSRLLLGICALIWGLANFTYIAPIHTAIVMQILLGAFFLFVYYKYDALTSFFSLFVFELADRGTVFFTSGSEFYVYSGYAGIVLVALIFVWGIISLLTRDRITDYDLITPAFVKNVTERQRLQRELEIARDVQMSFLPRRNPEFAGLQIAGKCIPAQEVGGDYYDFIEYGRGKFGILIGDVSGKGTQAAFYMTLTKGFLKAISKTCDSPSEMLIKMNELFYENVERGTFISMICGIFDMEKRVLRLSRAGHNPVILKSSSKNSIQMLNPTGLALGMEKGVLFAKTIQELEISFQKDDLFAFYTDGFTEAMDKKLEEYGEERLSSVINRHSAELPEGAIDNIIADVKQFTGKHPQHDDMTMVLVKIKEN